MEQFFLLEREMRYWGDAGHDPTLREGPWGAYVGPGPRVLFPVDERSSDDESARPQIDNNDSDDDDTQLDGDNTQKDSSDDDHNDDPRGRRNLD